MTVTIEPELEALVTRRVLEGAYPTAEKMVSEALRRLLEEQDMADILTPGATYHLYSPAESYVAAAQLNALLEQEKESRK